jgi:hypothetical protein
LHLGHCIFSKRPLLETNPLIYEVDACNHF